MSLPPAVRAVTEAFLGEVDARLPGRLDGLYLHGSLVWGEFVAGSDVDFVAVWDAVPTGPDLDALRAAHHAAREQVPAPFLDGFHATAADVAADPAAIEHRPAFFRGTFEAAGTIDLNLVTWHELALGAVVLRGAPPAPHTDLPALLAFTRHNLDTYWRETLRRVDAAGVEKVGAVDEGVSWIVLGVARLHHLLARHELTSKSGAGRYVLESLEARWERIAREALRVREHPDRPRLYTDPAERGRDVRDLLAALVEDGMRLPVPAGAAPPR